MHSEYLRSLFLNNDLSEGRFKVAGKPISLTDIRAPIFAVSTQLDHVAPWQSVYKIRHYTDTEVTFLLVSGGHNAGIVSEPGHPHRNFQLATVKSNDKYIGPEAWKEQTPLQQGSWWPTWCLWLEDQSSGKTSPPKMGATRRGYKPLGEAPGTYIMMK
jgi:polyhydroxyalkanoate synthase